MEEIQNPDKKKGRGKETLFRVAYQHQGHLIQLADYKANMIISVCTMIISAIIAIIGYGVVTGRGESYVPLLILPVIMIILSCLLSLIFAIRSASPKFIRGTSDQLGSLKSSLLFFGVIAEYRQDIYLREMQELLKNEDAIFNQMILDIYNQGLVLKLKYGLLKKAYQVLLVGFVASVLLFLVSFMWNYLL